MKIILFLLVSIVLGLRIRIRKEQQNTIEKQGLRYIIEILKRQSIINELSSEDQSYIKNYKDNFNFKYRSMYNDSIIDYKVDDLTYIKPIVYYDDFYNKLCIKGKLLIMNPKDNSNNYIYIYGLANTKVFSLFTSKDFSSSPVPLKTFRLSSISIIDISLTPCFFLSIPKESNEGSIMFCAFSQSDKELWLSILNKNNNINKNE